MNLIDLSKAGIGMYHFISDKGKRSYECFLVVFIKI